MIRLYSSSLAWSLSPRSYGAKLNQDFEENGDLDVLPFQDGLSLSDYFYKHGRICNMEAHPSGKTASDNAASFLSIAVNLTTA